MSQIIEYKTNMNKIGLDTEVKLYGKVVEITLDNPKENIKTLKIEILEFERVYNGEKVH